MQNLLVKDSLHLNSDKISEEIMKLPVTKF